MNVSGEFIEAVRLAWERAKDPLQTQDDAIRYMAHHIPIYLEYEAQPGQAAAAGCPQCLYLGIWTEA